jgi:hypothetical protein
LTQCQESFQVDRAEAVRLTAEMKMLASILLLVTLAWVGCAGKKKAVFSSVPGPSPGIAGSLPEPTPPPPAREQKKAPAKKTDLIVTPAKALNGKVATYNDVGRFVVLDFPNGRLPAVEQRMFVYRGGLKVGEVKINSWQRDHYVVADLASGEAQSGDEVREK